MTRFIWLALVVALVSDFPIYAQAKHPPKNFTNSIGMKFVWIPPGSFMMGSPKEEKKRFDVETQHKVTLTKGFYMGVYTVTQEQWQEVMGSNRSHFQGEKNLPVDSATWGDCQRFIKKLREKDQKPYRLPTEAEWEYSCRAGTTTPFHTGETISTEQANFNGEFIYGNGKKGIHRHKTTPVGSFPPNAWGLHDMHGNVWQCCQDWYGDYSQKDMVDPQGPEKGVSHVLRGGSWVFDPGCCRSAVRWGENPAPRFSNIGFRLCFSEDTEEKKGEPKPKIEIEKKNPLKQFTNSIGMKFVWIPPGSFMMGSPKEEKKRFDDIETQHKVTLTKGFYMGVYTVTQEQWKEVMSNNPSKFTGEKNLPVDSVSWNDCQRFIKKLREGDKKAYRLPTEAEWEYCCRAGTTTAFYFGDDAKMLGEHAWLRKDHRDRTHPVGQKKANAFGLFDMHGNVRQWCQDRFGLYPDKDAVDPQGPEKSGQDLRVMRGGWWSNFPEYCRSAFRIFEEPSYRYSYYGCRLCFSPD